MIALHISESNTSEIHLETQSTVNIPYVELDPTVPEWAKTPEKPLYTAAEVGAVAVIDRLTNSDLEDILR